MNSLMVFFWASVGSILSLVGGIMLLKYSRNRDKFIRYALPFGAGSMLAAAFLSLLPEAVEGSDIHQTAYWALGGFLLFFVLERLLGWFHHHHHDDVHETKNRSHVSLVIAGDTLHNAIDGVALGAAFLVNPAAGIATAIAIAAHELPQEIGDFGILLGKGMRPRKVVLVNILSAMATIITAMATYWLGGMHGFNPAPLLAVAAGFFIYIAAADIIPDIHEKPRREGNLQTIMLIVGVLVIAGVLANTQHSHEQPDDATNHDEHSHVE